MASATCDAPALAPIPPGCCAVCLLPPREDDNGSTQFVDGLGMTLVCGECQGRAPRRYPAGTPVPRRPGSDGDVRVCACCRTCLRPPEALTQVRVREGDHAHAGGVPAGALLVCPACLEMLRPHVAERLLAEGLVSRERIDAGWLPEGGWLT